MPKKSKSNDDWRIEAQKRAEKMRDFEADMYAMSYGFRDARHMKAEGARMEREWQSENSNNGDHDNVQDHPLPIHSAGSDSVHDSAGCSEPASRTSRGL